MFRLLNDKANLITTLGLLLGSSSILFTLKSEWRLSILFMLLAVLCDVGDGIVARKYRQKKDQLLTRIGVQLDSLSDLIHSGVAPAIFIFNYTEQSFISLLLFLLIIVSCYFRLAYFNCVGLTDDGYFRGVPVFYSPMILGTIYILDLILDFSNIVFYLYALIVPILQVTTSLRIKKFSEGKGFNTFISVLIIEIILFTI